eukprot:EG_transcript_53009
MVVDGSHLRAIWLFLGPCLLLVTAAGWPPLPPVAQGYIAAPLALPGLHPHPAVLSRATTVPRGHHFTFRPVATPDATPQSWMPTAAMTSALVRGGCSAVVGLAAALALGLAGRGRRGLR